MHVLQAPSWFPRTDNPYHGDFIHDFIWSLDQYGKGSNTYGILLAETYQYYLKNLLRPSDYFDLPESMDFVQSRGKLLPIHTSLGFSLYVSQFRRLFKKYIGLYGVPDLIHAHVYPAALAAIRTVGDRIPIVYTEQSSALLSGKPQNQKTVKIIRKVALKSDCTIAISGKMKAALSISGANVIQLFNPVDTEAFLPHSSKTEVFKWVAVGFLLKHKGFHEVIRAFSMLQDKNSTLPKIELHIIGDGPEKSALEQLSRDLSQEEKVIFHGVWSKEQIARDLGGYNAFVMGSYHEPFGIVVPEALSCGLPVVATRSGGPEDVISKPSLGRIVEPKNAAQLSEAMLEVIQRIDHFDSHKIRQHVIDHFSQKCFVRKIEAIYDRFNSSLDDSRSV